MISAIAPIESAVQPPLPVSPKGTTFKVEMARIVDPVSTDGYYPRRFMRKVYV